MTQQNLVAPVHLREWKLEVRNIGLEDLESPAIMIRRRLASLGVINLPDKPLRQFLHDNELDIFEPSSVFSVQSEVVQDSERRAKAIISQLGILHFGLFNYDIGLDNTRYVVKSKSSILGSLRKLGEQFIQGSAEFVRAVSSAYPHYATAHKSGSGFYWRGYDFDHFLRSVAAYINSNVDKSLFLTWQVAPLGNWLDADNYVADKLLGHVADIAEALPDAEFFVHCGVARPLHLRIDFDWLELLHAMVKDREWCFEELNPERRTSPTSVNAAALASPERQRKLLNYLPCFVEVRRGKEVYFLADLPLLMSDGQPQKFLPM